MVLPAEPCTGRGAAARPAHLLPELPRGRAAAEDPLDKQLPEVHAGAAPQAAVGDHRGRAPPVDRGAARQLLGHQVAQAGQGGRGDGLRGRAPEGPRPQRGRPLAQRSTERAGPWSSEAPCPGARGTCEQEERLHARRAPLASEHRSTADAAWPYRVQATARTPPCRPSGLGIAAPGSDWQEGLTAYGPRHCVDGVGLPVLVAERSGAHNGSFFRSRACISQLQLNWLDRVHNRASKLCIFFVTCKSTPMCPMIPAAWEGACARSMQAGSWAHYTKGIASIPKADFIAGIFVQANPRAPEQCMHTQIENPYKRWVCAPKHARRLLSGYNVSVL